MGATKTYRVEGMITRGTRTYYVEAESKEDALRIVESGMVEYDEQDIADIHFDKDSVWVENN